MYKYREVVQKVFGCSEVSKVYAPGNGSLILFSLVYETCSSIDLGKPAVNAGFVYNM